MKLDNAVNKFKNSLAGATTTEELFEINEANANMMLATMCLILACLHLFTVVIATFGFFELSITEATLAMLIPSLLMLFGYVICRERKGRGRWLKFLLIAIVLLTSSVNDFMLNYNVTLTMVVPVMTSIRYFDKKITGVIAILTAFIFGFASFFNTRFDNKYIDLNYVGFKEGTNLTYHNTFVQTVIDANFNKDAYTYYYMIENFIPKLMLFAIISVFCILIADKGRQMVLEEGVIARENARIEEELNTAANIQASMLNTDFPDYNSFRIYASMTPAKEVGGDFYDFFMLDDTHVAIVMADVSGKGIPASLFMVRAKTLLLEATSSESDLGEVFMQVNNKLCQNNEQGLFVTAFEGILDLTTGEFRYVNAGHEHPFIYSSKNNKYTPKQTKAAFVLGGMEGIKYKEGGVITLNLGDKIFQYTDGATEATNANNELFGMKRLEESLNNHSDSIPKDLLHNVKDDIDNFVGEAPQFDDLTMLCLEFKNYLTNE